MKTDGRNHPSSFQCGNYETENRKQTKIQCKYMQILISTCKYMQYKSGLKGLKYPESYPERFPESRMHNISTKISTISKNVSRTLKRTAGAAWDETRRGVGFTLEQSQKYRQMNTLVFHLFHVNQRNIICKYMQNKNAQYLAHLDAIRLD